MWFSRLWGSLRGMASSSRLIRWEQIKGLIPLISASIQPIADLCVCSSSSNCNSWEFWRLDEMITGKVSPSPKKTCFKPSGSWVNWTLGTSSAEFFGYALSRGSSSKRGCQNWVLLLRESMRSDIARVDSIELGLSLSNRRRSSSRLSKLLCNWTSSGIKESIMNVW